MHMPRSESTKLVLDTTRLQQEIHAHGFASLKDFADSVGVHRNTVGNYLSGKTALPDGLARILEALDLEPSEVLSLSVLRRHVPGLAVAGLIGSLHAAAHDAALVLFGSRAQGTAKRYSDYDIGVFRSEGLDFPTFSRLEPRVSPTGATRRSYAGGRTVPRQPGRRPPIPRWLPRGLARPLAEGRDATL